MLFLILGAIFVVVGWAIGTYFLNDWVTGALFFLIIAAVMNAISYFFSSKIVLWSYRAKVVSEAEAPRLYRIVRQISSTAGLPMPQVAIVPSQTPNAFATGRNPNHATVAATEGILKLLSDDELTGVLAHEMAHVKDRDILVMTVAATLAGAISFAARMFFWGSLFGGGNNRVSGSAIIAIVVAITAPIAALLLQLAVSRSREYLADAEGVALTRYPPGLISALQKISTAPHAMRAANNATAHLWLDQPSQVPGSDTSSMEKLFSTHPPIQDRIKRLQEM
jgi:heat shock protein HtpX